MTVTTGRKLAQMDLGAVIHAIRGRLTLPGRVVTLDIDSTCIKLIEVKGGKVLKWGSLPLTPPNGEGAAIPDPAELTAKVKQLLSSSGVQASKAITSLSGLYSVSRVVPVAILPGGLTTPQAVREAAAEIMPLDANSFYLSWHTIAEEEGTQQVLVVGVPKDVLDAQVQALKSARVNTQLLELKAMALARVVNRTKALILNIDSPSFDIVILADGIPEIMRTSMWQPNNLSPDEKADLLAGTLEMTAGFYNSQHPLTPLDPATPLFVTGQMSGDSTLGDRLKTRLGYPFETLVPQIECPPQMPVAEYAVNLGLALKNEQASAGGHEHLLAAMNILPQIYRPWKLSPRQVYLIAGMVVGVILLFQLYRVTTDAMGKTGDLQVRYDVLNSQLQQRQVEIKNRLPLQNAIKEYQTIQDMDIHVTGDIKLIRDAATEYKVQITTISHQDKSIVVSCEAGDSVTFEKFMTALQKTGRFSPVPPTEGYPFATGGSLQLNYTTPTTTPAAKAPAAK